MVTETNLPGTTFDQDLKTRYDRGSLEKGVFYYQVKDNVKTLLGKFVATVRQGSGDGMEIVMKFEMGGGLTILRESMWGSAKGEELSYFEKA
jgi:hypothetical protein